MTSTAPSLVDRFNRRVTYLRMSITDRCDLRCRYCMAEKMTFLPRRKVLTLEELALIGRAFCELGVDKIRLTGGEPLVRRGILKLVGDLAPLPGLKELVLTTNGTRLVMLADSLREGGVVRVNISLDTLRPERFREISRVGSLDTILEGIDAAIAARFRRIKLNSVMMRNRNHDEAVDLVRFAIEKGIDISFIEEMPLGEVDHGRQYSYYSSDEIYRDLGRHFTLLPCTESTGGPSRYFALDGYRTRVGFISPHSHNFCTTCNRVRLTCEGRLLLCLGQEHSVSLREVLRDFPGDMVRLKERIIAAMALKPEGHNFNLHERPIIRRHMSVTGG